MQKKALLSPFLFIVALELLGFNYCRAIPAGESYSFETVIASVRNNFVSTSIVFKEFNE